MALRYLTASPHYFKRVPARSGGRLSSRYLESECQRLIDSRRLICEDLLSKYLGPGLVCLDYGCGPGFLSLAVAPKAARVIACDISAGVLACAGVINNGPNIDYRQVAANGAIPAQDETVDLVYSFAVVQHLTDQVLKRALGEFRRVLKPGGTVVCHVVLDQEGWKSEADWLADRTVKGCLKWQFGMHCFSRSRGRMEELVTDAGFNFPQIVRIADLGVQFADDIAGQHLCVFTR